MILPLRDDDSDRLLTPYVNYALIAMNVLVFLLPQEFGTNDSFSNAYSTVPKWIVTGHAEETPDREVTDPRTREVVTIPGLKKPEPNVYVTLFTSMFMHGGIAHLLGNMLFLWIFGDNIEDALGHLRYLLFYLVCGVLASLAHIFFTIALYGVNSEEALVPSLGASGAISGVLGGYILLYPTRRVLVLMFRLLTEVPAYVAIGMWFVFQLISALGVLGPGSQQGGVAYAAHIGGFLAGLGLIKPFALGKDTDGRRQLRERRYRTE